MQVRSAAPGLQCAVGCTQHGAAQLPPPAHGRERRRQQLPLDCWLLGLGGTNLDVPASMGLALLHNRLDKLLGRRLTLAHAGAARF